MPTDVKIALWVLGVYLVVVYVLRFAFSLSQGRLGDDDSFVIYMWPLVICYVPIILVVDAIGIFSRWWKNHKLLGIVQFGRTCLYVLTLPFRPAELGSALHRWLLG